jgi:hypothetical protein
MGSTAYIPLNRKDICNNADINKIAKMTLRLPLSAAHFGYRLANERFQPEVIRKYIL